MNVNPQSHASDAARVAGCEEGEGSDEERTAHERVSYEQKLSAAHLVDRPERRHRRQPVERAKTK